MDVVLFVASAAAYRWHATRSQSRDTSAGDEEATPELTYALLQEQSAKTSRAVMELLADDPQFQKLAAAEGRLTAQRDAEDDAKLQVGIEFAQKKGVIDPKFVPAPYLDIDVLGKTPDQIARFIMERVAAVNKQSPGGSSGIIVLVGLSGTGKGTTMARLQQFYQEQNAGVVTWSNGNLFRSVTLLATTWCEQQTPPKKIADALTPDNLQKFMKMIEFGKFGANNTAWDIRIRGLGLDYLVSNIQNTVLKSPAVSHNIPTVAQATQGEVIVLAADAVGQMSNDGLIVLLEGRAQTVNYVPSPHRFQLVLPNAEFLIGQRRAAQRLVGAALGSVADKQVSPAQIQTTIRQALQDMLRESQAQ